MKLGYFNAENVFIGLNILVWRRRKKLEKGKEKKEGNGTFDLKIKLPNSEENHIRISNY